MVGRYHMKKEKVGEVLLRGGIEKRVPPLPDKDNPLSGHVRRPRVK